MTRIAIFADVQNLYYTTRQIYGRQFNYRALWQQIEEQGSINIANAYATDRADEGQRRFQSALRQIGFNVHLKPFIQRKDGTAKGDWDVGITIDVMEAASKVDHIILLSGDGDFDRLLRKVNQDYNVTTDAYGVPGLTARSLMEAATKFIPINESLLI